MVHCLIGYSSVMSLLDGWKRMDAEVVFIRQDGKELRADDDSCSESGLSSKCQSMAVITRRKRLYWKKVPGCETSIQDDLVPLRLRAGDSGRILCIP